MVEDEAPRDQNRVRLGFFVRRRRITLGYTSQDRLAEDANVSLSTIQRVESGRSTQLRDTSVNRLEETLAWEQGSIDVVLVGGDPTELDVQTPEVKALAIDIFKRRLLDVIAETSDPRVQEAAMRAAEGAARAVVDSFFGKL